MAYHDLRFDVHVSPESERIAARLRDDAPFRIAILGDFSARASRGGVPDRQGISSRRAYRIDRDDIDATMEAIAPELRLVLDPASPAVTMRFTEMDDFHPDRIAERLPLMQELLEMRREAASGSPRPSANRPSPRTIESSANAMADGSLLDMMLSAGPESTPLSGGARTDELADFVRQAVRPHAVAQTSASQDDMIAKIDGALEAAMRVVLRNPHFKALEALWRGVDFVLRRLETSTDLQVFLIDVTRDELAADLDADAPEDAQLHELMHRRVQGVRDGCEWSLVLADVSLGRDDLPLMRALAAFGRTLGAPVVAGAQPVLAGATSFAAQWDSDEWTPDASEEWEAFRDASDARFLGLALPRLFLRLPYGSATDECSFMHFEEHDASVATGASHDSHLWGNAAFPIGLIIARGVAESGAPATQGTLDGLPLYVETVDGEPRAVPCAEAVLTQSSVDALLDRGLIPLVSMRDGDAVRAPRIQSVATPPRPLAIRGGRSA